MPRKAKVRPDEPGYERIQQAGLELFGERGYEATSIAEIGERAGITKSVLYHYYRSKGDLYSAVLSQQTDELIETVKAAVDADPDAPRLRVGVEAYLAFLAARPEAWRLLLRDRPADPELARLHRKLEADRSQALTESLTGERKRAEERIHVELVATAIKAFVAWWYEHREVPIGPVVDSIAAFAATSIENIPGARAESRA